MNKPLIIFGVAFALSLGFTLLSLISNAISSIYISSYNYNVDYAVVTSLIGGASGFIGLAVVFVIFYYLGNKQKIQVAKPIVLAVLLGSLLGSSILFWIAIPFNLTQDIIFKTYLSFTIGYLFSSVFYYFLPALTALLFAELKGKRLTQNTIELESAQSPV